MPKKNFDITFTHDPNDHMDYTIDYSDFLCVDGDVIVTSEWIVPTGITSLGHSHDDERSIIWLTGGTIGEKYYLTNRITTQKGRQMDKTIRMKVEEL